MSKTTYTETEQAAMGYTGYIRSHTTGHGEWLQGTVETPIGYAAVDSSPYRDHSLSVVSLVVNGRIYRRQWKRTFTKRGLAIVARRFARELEAQDGA